MRAVLSIIAISLFLAPAAQEESPGAKLLFAQAKTKLKPAQKNFIFQHLGFLLSDDGARFIADKDAANYPFDARVYPTDLNRDGKEEVFIVFGNGYTSGAAEATIVAYIPDAQGRYKMNLGFPGLLPLAIPGNRVGYPDLIVPGPGMEHPLWRWKGGEYVYASVVRDASLPRLRAISLETLSQRYQDRQR